MGKTLTPRQDKFIAEYAKSGVATQAAIIAGYSQRSARVTGSRLLTNAALQLRLKQAGEQGLETLIDIAANGQSEVARVHAAAILMDRAYGKPSRPAQQKPDITINFNKIGAHGSTTGNVLTAAPVSK